MSPSNPETESILEWFSIFMRNAMHSTILHSRECGLSMPQLGTLMILRKRGVRAISDIGTELNISTAAASQMIHRMVSEGLILRTEDPEDRRVKQISLTEKGMQLLQENFQARQKWVEDLLQALTDDEKEKVSQTFKLLVDKLRQHEKMTSSSTSDPTDT
jgi:DNA-binding MarR family transcriptional regulator